MCDYYTSSARDTQQFAGVARQLRHNVKVSAVLVDGVRVPMLADVFANAVRAERSRRGWRQSDLAERCGWSLTVQGAIERGARQVNLDDIEKLCAALGRPLIRMLDGAEDEQLRHLGLL